MPSFDLDIRLTDSTYETVKLLEGIPPTVLHSYSSYMIAVTSWMELRDSDFPIPVNKDEIEKFENINTPVEDLEPKKSPLTEFDI